MFNSEDHPQLRLNLLTDEWIIVSPHRTKRPWAGQIEAVEEKYIPRHDMKNPLCPGATRSSGKVNENYKSTYVFENDFPALLKEIPEPTNDSNESLLQSRSAEGTCRVMCFHPYSDLSLPLMDLKDIQMVIKEWIAQYEELSNKYPWVQIFENKGNMMGCSNSHPHCQIWGCKFLPNEAIKEENSQMKYYKEKKSSMLLDYINLEINKKERMLVENEEWLVLVPYCAHDDAIVSLKKSRTHLLTSHQYNFFSSLIFTQHNEKAMWPFELMVLPKKPTQRLNDLSSQQQESLSSIMKNYLTKYDNLFKTSFPYSMGWHSAPGNEDSPHWQLHAHYYPPLLRSATVKKHMVGFEMLSGPMRDLTPEKAASTLRDLPDKHYKSQ